MRAILYLILALWIFALLVVSMGAFAQVPGVEHEPRDLGHTAVLHVYWYVPKTLEITHVETVYYHDLADCKENEEKAMAFFSAYASEGDYVFGQCVALEVQKVERAPEAAT